MLCARMTVLLCVGVQSVNIEYVGGITFTSNVQITNIQIPDPFVRGPYGAHNISTSLNPYIIYVYWGHTLRLRRAQDEHFVY